MKNKKIFWGVLALLFVAGAYFVFRIVTKPATSVVYRDNQYGFAFTIPLSWKGYSIIESKWTGYASGASGDVPAETGPIVSIRHPLWTKEKPRQDIPIMVFTISQWNRLLRDQIHVGAAPINPSRLGFNENYVFALPARYNYAFPEGFEEVEQILQTHPLRAISKKHISDENSILLCGSIPDNSTENVVSTTRIFINLPKALYPNKQNNLRFTTTAGDAAANWVSNAGPYGEAFEATDECFSYYYEFDGVGIIDLETKGSMGAPDYNVRFVVNAAR
jgi:hypothetical protein